MKKVIKNIYKFNELTEEAKTVAIVQHVEFLVEISEMYYNDEGKPHEHFVDHFVVKAAQKAESLQTPWFFGQIILDDHKQDVIDDIEANDYDFYSDGTIYHASK